MAFSQTDYIARYNKENYKIYSFRVKRSDTDLIDFLDNKKNRNQLIVSFLREEAKKRILSFHEIKTICEPIFEKYGVKEAFLFGSYARNEAKIESDIDIFYSGINHSIHMSEIHLFADLEDALGKEIDLIEEGSSYDKSFFNEIKKDFVKIY